MKKNQSLKNNIVHQKTKVQSVIKCNEFQSITIDLNLVMLVTGPVLFKVCYSMETDISM